MDFLSNDIANWAGGFFPTEGEDGNDNKEVPGECNPTQWVAVYNFLRDRMRAVASDINVQHIRDSLCVDLHERMARFYIFAGYGQPDLTVFGGVWR